MIRRTLGTLCLALIASPLFAADKDIVDTAVAAGSFKTLATALQAAGLVDTLKGPGPFTVFAPTDEAFAKLPAGTVEELLKPENKEKLTQILTYHVVAGKVPASEAIKLNGQSVQTVAKLPLPIKVQDGKVMVGPATVVQADVEATNGVIHVIDTVLLPPPSATAQPAPRVITVTMAPAAHSNYTPVAPAPVYYAPAPASVYHAPAHRGWGTMTRRRACH